MAFQIGDSSVLNPDQAYIRLMKDMIDFIRGSHVGSGVINAGGAAYVVGDILGITGGTTFGTGAHPAEFEVVSEAGGVITTLRLNNSGSYSIEPATLTGNALVGGTGAGATVDLIMDSWVTAVPNAGGTGYVVGEILTLVGGTVETTAGTFEVLTEAAGVVLTVKPVNIGDYSELPTSPVTTTASASGINATLDLTRSGWLIRTTDYVDDQTDTEFWAEGVNNSGSNPFIGARSAISGGNPQWMMAGASGFDGLALWEDQPGISPVTAFITSTPTSRVPLTVSDLDFFFYVNPRRLTAVFHTLNTYEMIYLGLFVPFITDPSSKWPLPLMIAGTTQRNGEDIGDPQSGLHTPLTRPGQNQQFMRDTTGTWNLRVTGNTPWDIWPENSFNSLTNEPEGQAPNISSGSGTETPFGGLWTTEHYLGSPQDMGYLNVGIGTRLYFLLPFTFYQDEPGALQILGEVDGVFKIPARDIIAENIIVDQLGREHMCFPIINLTNFQDFYTILME